MDADMDRLVFDTPKIPHPDGGVHEARYYYVSAQNGCVKWSYTSGKKLRDEKLKQSNEMLKPADEDCMDAMTRNDPEYAAALFTADLGNGSTQKKLRSELARRRAAAAALRRRRRRACQCSGRHPTPDASLA